MIHQFLKKHQNLIKEFFIEKSDIKNFVIDISTISFLKNFAPLNNEHLNNFIFGIPFKKNTFIKIGNAKGYVNSVRLRHLILRDKGKEIYIPIDKLYKDIVEIEK